MEFNTDTLKKYLDILDLDPDSHPTPDEIYRAYHKLETFYTSDSIVLDPLDDELDDNERILILQKLEDAFHFLNDHFKAESQEEELLGSPENVNIEIEDTLVEYVPETDWEERVSLEDHIPISIEQTNEIEPEKEIEPVITLSNEEESENHVEYITPPATIETPIEIKSIPEPPKENGTHSLENLPVNGLVFQMVREKKGLSINDLASQTGIAERDLIALEMEQFEKFQEAGDLRYFIVSLAKALSMDHLRAAEEYMKRYRQWKREHEY